MLTLEKVTTPRRCWSMLGCCQRQVRWSTLARNWDHSCQDDSTNIQTSHRWRPTDCTVSAHCHRSLVLMLATARYTQRLTVTSFKTTAEVSSSTSSLAAK